MPASGRPRSPGRCRGDDPGDRELERDEQPEGLGEVVHRPQDAALVPGEQPQTQLAEDQRRPWSGRAPAGRAAAGRDADRPPARRLTATPHPAAAATTSRPADTASTPPRTSWRPRRRWPPRRAQATARATDAPAFASAHLDFRRPVAVGRRVGEAPLARRLGARRAVGVRAVARSPGHPSGHGPGTRPVVASPVAPR